MPRILIVYYSRSGSTREVARRLGSLLGADLEEILDPTPRTGLRGFLRSACEARLQWSPPIVPGRYLPADYDVVVLGTPIWAMSVSSPVQAYLKHHRSSIRAAAFFCTCAHTGGRRVFQQMEDACGQHPLVRMQLREDELGMVSADLAIERFATQLLASLKQP